MTRDGWDNSATVRQRDLFAIFLTRPEVPQPDEAVEIREQLLLVRSIAAEMCARDQILIESRLAGDTYAETSKKLGYSNGASANTEAVAIAEIQRRVRQLELCCAMRLARAHVGSV